MSLLSFCFSSISAILFIFCVFIIVFYLLLRIEKMKTEFLISCGGIIAAFLSSGIYFSNEYVKNVYFEKMAIELQVAHYDMQTGEFIIDDENIKILKNGVKK